MIRRGCLFAIAATVFACGDGGGFPDAREIDAPPPPGQFTITWSLTDANGAPITCDEIGAISVTVSLRNRSVQGGFTEVFTCGTGMGTSERIVPGLYDLSFSLVGPGGDPMMDGLIVAATPQLGVQITSGAETALDPVRFAVQATGGVALTVDAPATGANCAPVAQQGAGITTMTLSLERGGVCQPVTLMVGATPYTVNCTTPTPRACIENTETITATNLPSGNYTIRIRGSRGVDECFSNNDQLPVPPLGRTLTRALNLAQAQTPMNCQ